MGRREVEVAIEIQDWWVEDVQMVDTRLKLKLKVAVKGTSWQ